MRVDWPRLFSCHWALESFIGDKGQREIPEKSAEGLDLERVDENFLMFKSYKQEGSELFYGVMGFRVYVCFCVFPSAAILDSKT